MKTNEVNEVSSKKDWTFKRTLRVSIRIAFLYAILSVVLILIFGSKSEIIWKRNIVEELNGIITLPWNSWFNIFPNFFGIIFSGTILILFGKFIDMFDKWTSKDKKRRNGLLNYIVAGGIILGIILGFLLAFNAGIYLGLGIGLFSGLICGLFFVLFSVLIAGITWTIGQICSKGFWVAIGKGISLFWRWLIC